MKSWLRQHIFAVKEACRHAFRARSGFLLNVLVVAIALALPIAGLTLLENVRPVSEQLSVEPEISIFLVADTPRETATALITPLRRILQQAKTSAKVEFVSREKALDALKNKTGLSDALDTLGSNPLPDAYIVKLAAFQNARDATRVDAIAAQLKTLPNVEYVQVDSAWVKRLAALLHLLRLALLFLAIALGSVVVAVAFNTIRLQVMSQREEIEVSRLVGASDSFIYRPFYYSGALLGLCAGGIALAVVTIALQPLNETIAELARLYSSEFRLVPLGIAAMMQLLVLSAVLGLVGSWLSVRRHLARLTRIR